MKGKKVNHEWERVVATPRKESEILRQKLNKAVLESDSFSESCKKAGVPVTKRQASKFNNNKGIARKYKSKGGAINA